jgi:hypothetical protein
VLHNLVEQEEMEEHQLEHLSVLVLWAVLVEQEVQEQLPILLVLLVTIQTLFKIHMRVEILQQ